MCERVTMFNETVLTNTEICIYINVICQERVFSFGFCQLPKTTENILSSRDLQNQVGGWVAGFDWGL